MHFHFNDLDYTKDKKEKENIIRINKCSPKKIKIKKIKTSV